MRRSSRFDLVHRERDAWGDQPVTRYPLSCDLTMPQYRVLVFSHAGGSPYHGPNMRWYYLGRALQAWNVSVDIVSSSSFHKYFTPPSVSKAFSHERIDGVGYHWVRTRAYSGRGLAQVRNQLEYVAGCYSQLNGLARKQWDVVVASSPHPFCVYPAASLARRTSSRLVYEVRDLWPDVLLQLGRFSSRHPYVRALRWAEVFAVRHADKIVSVKQGDYAHFEERYALPHDRFVWVPNGFLPDGSVSPAPPSLVHIRSQHKHLVGYVGALSSYYELDGLLELAARFRGDDDVAFVVVGKGDREAVLRTWAQEQRLKNVYFMGPVPRTAVPTCLELFDVCYVGLRDLPLHRFGVSCNKIYEYMHAGKPILACYNVGFDPVAEAGCGIVRPPSDIDGLADGLRRLLTDDELRAMMGVRGREYFDRYHDFAKVAGRFYSHVVENDPARTNE